MSSFRWLVISLRMSFLSVRNENRVASECRQERTVFRFLSVIINLSSQLLNLVPELHTPLLSVVEEPIVLVAQVG